MWCHGNFLIRCVPGCGLLCFVLVIVMMTSSNGNNFRVTGHLCGEFTGLRWIPSQRPVTRKFDVFFDLRLNKWLNDQSWSWWFETLLRPLWRHCKYYPRVVHVTYLRYLFTTSQIKRVPFHHIFWRMSILVNSQDVTCDQKSKWWLFLPM